MSDAPQAPQSNDAISDEHYVERHFVVPESLSGKRFDQALAELMPEFSRGRLQNWIKSGEITLDGKTVKSKQSLIGGESVEVLAHLVTEVAWQPQKEIKFDVVYEDEDVIIVDKPAGLVVHPGAGNTTGTLINGLMDRYPELEKLPRAGVVHRIDKDTSGLLMVARTLEAHTSLVDQLQEKTAFRQYLAVCYGEMTGGGEVNAPVGRHPKQRTKMAVVDNGKPAVTHYRIEERLHGCTLIRCQLETGRTHQIRVHMAHQGYALVGDFLYAGRVRFPKGATEAMRQGLIKFKRQALHATTLGIEHPRTGEYLEWTSELPQDMLDLIEVLSANSEA